MTFRSGPPNLAVLPDCILQHVGHGYPVRVLSLTALSLGWPSDRTREEVNRFIEELASHWDRGGEGNWIAMTYPSKQVRKCFSLPS